MICPECKVERKDEDFLKKTVCFKCQYLDKVKPPKVKPPLTCKMCGKQFEKKNRWVYCSWSCQQKAETEQKKHHWTHDLV